MPSQAVVNAVEERLRDNFDRCPIIGVNLQGEPPKDGSEYALVQYPLANSGQLTFGSPGSNLFREEGAFRVIVHARRGRGVSTGLQWADEIAGLFRRQFFDGVRTFAPSPPSIDDANERGSYMLLPVTVPYQFDFLG